MKNNSINPNLNNHLGFLDGIRGLAALFVVIHHAYMEVRAIGLANFSPTLRSYTHWLIYGGVGVDVFIVLSGYCLMLPVIRSEGKLSGGLRAYLFRRARRIIPPYYFAMMLIILLVLLVPKMSQPLGVRWDLALPIFDFGNIVSHILLIHNFNSDWLYKIAPTLWSIAVEWQIYFVFALILLPIWRFVGTIAMLIVAVVLGLIPVFAFDLKVATAPWLLGLFAFGCVAAIVNNSPRVKTSQLSFVSALFCVAGLLTFIYLARTNENYLWDKRYIQDGLAGLVAASFLVYCGSFSKIEPKAVTRKPLVVKFLETKIMLFLGSFSYSLYLLHFPVLSLWTAYLVPLNLKANKMLLAQLIGGVTSSLIISYIFYLMVERHFVKKKS